MFRPLRRSRQALPPETCADILTQGAIGILAVHGDDGYPYAVPVNYVYHGGRLYIHCAKTGHKLDAIRADDKVSFCVIDQEEIVPQTYNTLYRSAMVFGRARILETEEEKRASIGWMAVKYAPDDTPEHREMAIEREYPPLCMVEITVEHLSGKESLELAVQREQQEGVTK